MDIRNAIDALERGRSPTIAVVGDVMLDFFVYCDAERISPEAPVPVLKRNAESFMLGAAGNVAANIRTLGGTPLLVSATGADPNAQRLKDLCARFDIATEFMLESERRMTSVKTRYLARTQHVIRVDDEVVKPLDAEDSMSLLDRFDRVLSEHDVDLVVVSDYGKGVLQGGVCERVIDRAGRAGLQTVIDPKGVDFAPYRGGSFVTPNLNELRLAASRGVGTDDEITGAARSLLNAHGLGAILTTRSAQGMSLVTDESVEHVNTQIREVYDVSGAGDTVVAAFALVLALGEPPAAAMQVANAAAGIVVGKPGTATVTLAELKKELGGSMPRSGAANDHSLLSLEPVLARWRAEGKSIGFTNGCFDILHVGHVSVLEDAKANCDRLVVGVNSDDSVRKLKGAARPINAAEDRAGIVQALRCVDAVVIFGEETPERIISAIRPDVLVKGEDYAPEDVVGSAFVTGNGGKVILSRLREGYSTSGLIEALKDSG